MYVQNITYKSLNFIRTRAIVNTNDDILRLIRKKVIGGVLGRVEIQH